MEDAGLTLGVDAVIMAGAILLWVGGLWLVLIRMGVNDGDEEGQGSGGDQAAEGSGGHEEGGAAEEGRGAAGWDGGQLEQAAAAGAARTRSEPRDGEVLTEGSMALKGKRKTVVLRVYRAVDGWRWRLIAGNGKIVADSGEAYVKRATAVARAKALESLVAAARLEVDE
jgi:uncharacterized protein YegP (UPF0339 family)